MAAPVYFVYNTTPDDTIQRFKTINNHAKRSPIPYCRSSANSLIRLLRIFIFLFICRRTFAHQSVITDVHLDLMDPQRLGTHALRQPHP